MFSFLSSLFGSKRAVVVSWDTTGVWVVSAKRHGDTLSVGTVVQQSLPEQADSQAQVRLLRRALLRARSPKTVHVPIPGSAGISFVTTLPRPYGNYDIAIMDHLRAFCELHDISFPHGNRTSYTVLDSSETLVVSANVCDHAYIDTVTRTIEKAGYKAKPVLVADSAARLVQGRGGSIIVSVGIKETTMLRMIDGVVVETLSHPVGVDALVESLSRYRSMSVRDARDVISQYGLLQAHPDNAALSELFSVLAPVFRSIDSFVKNSRMPYQHVRMTGVVDHVYVVGPGASVPGMCTAISVRTGIPADIISPRDLAWDADTIPPLSPSEIHHILPHVVIASAVLGAKFRN